jgi:hypothetical protein
MDYTYILERHANGQVINILVEKQQQYYYNYYEKPEKPSLCISVAKMPIYDAV